MEDTGLTAMLLTQFEWKDLASICESFLKHSFSFVSADKAILCQRIIKAARDA